MSQSSPRRLRSPKESEPLEPPTPLDVARCPKCGAPMSLRHSRHGPYFHCRCPTNRNHAPPQHRSGGEG